jgi:hypothetical protein
LLLHIGGDLGIPLTRVLFVLNEKGMTPQTRAYVDKAKKERRYIRCGAKPKCYVAVKEYGREVLYESMIASSTLEKRWRDEIARKYLNDAAVLTITDA